MMHASRAILLTLMLLGLAGPTLAQAQPAPPPAANGAEARQAEEEAAFKAAFAAAMRGPTTVPLLDQAGLKLPAGMVYVPTAEAGRLWRALGNNPGQNLIGLVMTPSDDDQWIVEIRWTKEGYIKDDDAKDIDADHILENLREGTEEGNKSRAERGFTPLEITGWTQPPRYDATSHRLAWALIVKDKGVPDPNPAVNFNTRALGREGFFSLNLITGQEASEKYRNVAATLLAGLDYNEGKRYQDFNGSTDHVAEYGLAALLGVVALKKLGLIALAGAFILKFAKVGLLAVAGIGFAIRRMFRKAPPAA